MKAKLLTINHLILLLCASIYLGTGVSMVLFSFPVASQLTVDNYWLHYVPQIQAATEFFTALVKVMLVCGTIMLIAEWRQPTRWVPIVFLLALIAASLLTTEMIFPLNEEMAGHIRDEARMHAVLDEFMRLSTLRLWLWALEWLVLAWYFARWACRARFAPTVP
ncbi:hypothetical protein ED236_05820 [Pseudomethylobacillus aquaticus]|uniref:DUF1772 domain-containing protein n=1 Tax=Pseudomethylobacillus aquaticus TaxID=2676064 RepID=A0A3N0V346_9PROT|nr:hypothetical protein [Pseudomethylobacillus aquaticus]ROH87189.1 hypothetical protein ED236_05820 [Pseudomethylobacillus aquaticus]